MTFRWWYPILNRPNSRWGWLAPLHVKPINNALPPLPWGWRYLHCPHRHAAYPLPLWIYWLVSAWVYRWWALEPLVRVGILTFEREGGYWDEVRPWFWTPEREQSFREMWRGLPN